MTTTRLDRRGQPTSSRVVRPGGELPEEPSARAERHAGGRDWEVEGTGFWQVHPAAADALVAAVAGFAEVRAGETVLDLYAGAGLFGGVLAPAVGAEGRVVCVESEEAACAAADANLAGLPQAEVWQGDVDAEGLDELLAELGTAPDVVVLDPPRAGAGQAVSRLLAGTGARAVVYVACDPASLARDVAVFAEGGLPAGRGPGFRRLPDDGARGVRRAAAPDGLIPCCAGAGAGMTLGAACDRRGPSAATVWGCPPGNTPPSSPPTMPSRSAPASASSSPADSPNVSRVTPVPSSTASVARAGNS